MTPKKQIALLGNSHLINPLKVFLPAEDYTAAWHDGARYGRFPFPLLPEWDISYLLFNPTPFAPLVDCRENQLFIHEKFSTLLQRFSPPIDTLFTFLHGTEHAVVSMIRAVPPWDFYDPELPLAEKVQVVAREDVTRYARNILYGSICAPKVLKMMHKNSRIIYVEPPPTIPDHDHILANPEIFTESIQRFGLSSPEFRLKVYKLFRDIIRAELATLNMEFIPPPLPTHDAHGFLREKYWQGCTHANVEYGALVMEQIAAKMQP